MPALTSQGDPASRDKDKSHSPRGDQPQGPPPMSSSAHSLKHYIAQILTRQPLRFRFWTPGIWPAHSLTPTADSYLDDS
eukprot:8431077-Pyramimonas_sp.AAC.2